MKAFSILRHAGSSLVVAWCSLVAEHEVSCLASCGILVPPRGIEPTFPTLEGGCLTTGSPGKSQEISFQPLCADAEEVAATPLRGLELLGRGQVWPLPCLLSPRCGLG